MASIILFSERFTFPLFTEVFTRSSLEQEVNWGCKAKVSAGSPFSPSQEDREEFPREVLEDQQDLISQISPTVLKKPNRIFAP